MKVYEFLYCSSIYESAYGTISLHGTKVGAYKAMRKHIMTEYQKWYDERMLYGKYRKLGHKFGCYESWTIRENELNDIENSEISFSVRLASVRLAETVIKVLEVKAKSGYKTPSWEGYSSGNGTEIGVDIERLIRQAKRLNFKLNTKL